MADPLGTIGLSFSPTGQTPQNGQGSPDSLTPVQQAIKILSLRLPQNPGAGSLTPSALLSGPGSMGLPGGGAPGGFDLMALLRRLMQPGAEGGPNMGGGMLSAPNPHITPGVDSTPLQGPGMPTMPMPGGGPTMDRSNPGDGNRFGGPPLNTSGTLLPPSSPVGPPQTHVVRPAFGGNVRARTD